MKKALRSLILPILLGSLVSACSKEQPHSKYRLWYNEPAADWMTEALPTGNGEMGTMIFGSVPEERIQITEKSLWPALPSAWPEGKVKGLCARGGFIVDMEWKEGALTQVSIVSKYGFPLKLKYGEKTMELEGEPGRTYLVDGALEMM